MLKKIMSILLCFALIVTLVGCAAKEEIDEKEDIKKKSSTRKKNNKDDDNEKESFFSDDYLGNYVTNLDGEKNLYLNIEKYNGEYRYMITYFPKGATHAAEELWGRWETDKNKFTLEHENETNLAEYKVKNIRYEDEKYIYIDFEVKKIMIPKYKEIVIKDGTYKFERDEFETSEKIYNVDIGKTYKRGDNKNGGTITFNSDGTVEEKSWSENSELGLYRGTYVIDGNKIIVTITEMYEFNEWGMIPEQITVHTITDNNAFHYEFNGNIFEYTE